MANASHDSPRYVVGIDLGTTHTVVACADTERRGKTEIELFPIEQLVAPGEVAARPLLPSVRYHPAKGELSETDTRLPWRETSPANMCLAVLGEWARALGAKSHGRLVTSAKSWLSHPAVDRTAPILPWGAPDDVPKVSPVEASASYLAHVRSAWNYRLPDFPLERQELVVTVPASFDEGARALTLEAGRLAGLDSVRLLEEPQAACYDWLWQHRKTLRKQLEGVRLILVCDVGGGTTDFTLIRVDDGDEAPRLTRIGVGNHLMLGGDNVDLTLAHWVEKRLDLGGRRFSASELAQLVDQCRGAKERLLGAEAPDSATVTLLGGGARMVGGARSVTVGREDILALVVDGFFPLVAMSELPERRRGGVVEFGLPYAADPAISRHAAAFLAQHHQLATEATGESDPVPDVVLLNGGVFRSPTIVKRMMDLVGSWGPRQPKQLRNDRPDQAVAFGAVAYALARRGLNLQKIEGGSARSYFVLVDTDRSNARHGVCVLPRGSEEGREIALIDRSFLLKLGQPIRFSLFSSIEDAEYQPGDVVAIDPDQFLELPPLAVAFERETGKPGKEQAVRLVASMTEVGTLDLRCVATDDSDRSWTVEFLLRPGGRSEPTVGESPHPRLGEAQEHIERIFGKKVKNVEPKAVKGLRSSLERLLGSRESWDTALCRSLFARLLEGLPHRRRSVDHERLWLNLVGYCLRPGFGYPLDDWRVDQLWSIYPQGLQFINESQNWAEWWTLWRRIAGGLGADSQARVFADLAEFINPALARRGNLVAVAKKRSYEDMVRLSGSLERLSAEVKVELGGWLLERLQKSGEPPESWWALGRVGARVPFHGSTHNVVPRDTAEQWIARLLTGDWRKNPAVAFAVMLIARMSGDRERDIDPTVRERVLIQLKGAKAPDSWLNLVDRVQELDVAEEKRIFGEALPPGLQLVV